MLYPGADEPVADRLSTEEMKGNQLWLDSSVPAYTLPHAELPVID